MRLRCINSNESLMMVIPMNRLFSCRIILCLLAFTACEKEEPVEITYSEIDPELRKNYSFNEGSFWVYENDSLEIDTFKLMALSEGYTQVLPRGGTARHGFQTLLFYSTFHFQSFNYYLQHNYIKHNGGGDWGEQGQPIYQLNQPQGHSWNGLTVGEKMDTLRVLNEVFHDVEQMRVDEEKLYGFYEDRDLYFAPKIGLIKYVMHTPSGDITWNLKSYEIQ